MGGKNQTEGGKRSKDGSHQNGLFITAGHISDNAKRDSYHHLGKAIDSGQKADETGRKA